jgi:UDP-N-acetylmuramoylalanine--D-glutamate ligase
MVQKRITILGAGESGVGAALLAKQKEYCVFVSDKNFIKPKFKKVLIDNEIPFEENKHTLNIILESDEIIKSPGIANNLEIIKKIKIEKINIISEIEFASRYTKAKKICITGSNGKTTTTLLTHHILKNAGINVGLAGNVGKSFALQVSENNFDYYVLEISSFQLDDMYEFKAEMAILLNITPDHLDRYNNDFNKYVQSKFRIIQNQTENDFLIYNLDDQVITNTLVNYQINSHKYPFTLKKQIMEGAWLNENELIFAVNQDELEMPLGKLSLLGKHNIYNSMAAGIAARVLDIRKSLIKECLSDYKNIEHRLEHVANVHGIEFINDSKATNVNSVWYALDTQQKPVVWIVGGQDKGNDYLKLKELVRQKVKAIVCLGKDNSKILQAFSGDVVTIIETKSVKEAVFTAYKLSKNGDVILLSPACASFDLFENYEDRGRQFKEIVNEL